MSAQHSSLTQPTSPFIPFSPNPLTNSNSSTPTTTSTLSVSTAKLQAPLGSSNLRYASSRKSIYDRHLNRTQRAELSKSSFAFLFSEMINYTQQRISNVADLEKKLNLQGYAIGQRLLELLLYREGRPAKRETRVLGMLQFIAQTLYRHLFGKPADGLEKSRDNEDEYMLIDNDPAVNTFISVPKEMGNLNCAAFVAGIIEAAIDGSQFPGKVTAISVPSDQFPGKTVFLIKFEESVLEREAMLG